MFGFGKGSKNKSTNGGESALTTSTTIVHSTSTYSTTQIFKSSCVQLKSDSVLVRSLDGTKIDAMPFKLRPARSAFCSEPLTRPPLNRLGVNRNVSPLPVIYNSVGPTNIIATSPPPDQTLREKIKIRVVKNGKLYDDPSISKVPVYSTHSKQRGKLLLINNVKFLCPKQNRKGAELDETHLIELFKQLGFIIAKYRDLKKKEMEDKVLAFRSDSVLKKVDICVVVVMSHGIGGESSDSTEVACVDGQTLHTHWIVNQFDNDQCPNLVGKPKIFIFQCCRGDQRNIQHDSVPSQLPRKLSDILIAYSTIPGFVSHRDPNTGTWYIQAVCKILMQHACDTDMENLLKMVDDVLSKLVTELGSRQTSSFENRGFKTCYLHP